MEKFKIYGDKTILTPTILGVRLEKNFEQANPNTIKLYQQQIGSLIYLMSSTRPDIAFIVNNYARYMSNPSEEHFKALNRIWQYIRTTQSKGILCKGESEPSIDGYIDSEWGGNYFTRRSTTGYIFLIGNSSISWSLKLQKSVVVSSCEVEYMALKEASKELI